MIRHIVMAKLLWYYPILLSTHVSHSQTFIAGCFFGVLVNIWSISFLVCIPHASFDYISNTPTHTLTHTFVVMVFLLVTVVVGIL